MSDEEIIRRRLMIDGDGTGDARMMTKYIKSFIKWCSMDDTPQDNQMQFDRLMTQLASVEHAYLKWSNVINMNDVEVQHYDTLKDSTLVGVGAATEQIDVKKLELENAKEVRRNRMEYDALARLIKEHPPRPETADKLKALNEELDSLKEFKGRLDEKLDLRKKQMHVLVKTLHELQCTLKEPPITRNTPQKPQTIDLTN